MRFILLLFIAALFSSSVGYAGDKKKVKPDVPVAVYLLPSQLIPVAYSGGVTIGAEVPLLGRFAITCDGTKFYEGAGFMARANLKYYFQHYKNDDEQPYVAIEYGYKTQAYEGLDNIREPGPKPGASITYPVYKFANTLVLKYGRQVCYYDWLYFDFYAGLGLRYKVANNDLTDDQIQSLYHWHEGFIESFTNRDFRGYTPTLSIGVKIGYRFK